MNDEVKEKSTLKEMSLQQILMVLFRKSWIIFLVSVLCGLAALLVTRCLITPKYQSSAMFYVNNGSGSTAETVEGSSLSTNDINTRKELVESYIVILKSPETLMAIIDNAEVDRSYEELDGMISASAVNSTEIFQVVVTSPDPDEALSIANAIKEVLPERIKFIITGSSAKVVNSPTKATEPSSPSPIKNTLLGFLIGVIFSVAAVVLYELFDVTVRTEEDLQRGCSHPVLAAVPDMMSQSKGGYYYRESGKKRSSPSAADKDPVLVGPGISFAASEAYKLLRTKLQFSFVDEKDCHIIGVSSAMAGEGKSLSSVNLAYSLAQLEKRVLLVDCDMRRPSLNAKLPIKKAPGLSNYLTRQVGKEDVIQKYATPECEFDVIAAGRNPPNPIELLSSGKMQKILDEFREFYDFIIMDLPPVGEVSDALVAAKLVDGILLVVRQNYCNGNALKSAVSQFGFVDSRILGVVFNCTSEHSGHYGKYYKGYRGYRGYYNRYEGSYIAATSAAKRSAGKEERK